MYLNFVGIPQENTSQGISRYFDQIEGQVVTLSSNLMLVEAMQQFTEASSEYVGSLSSEQLLAKKAVLRDFYSNKFDKRFRDLNGGNSANAASLLNKASDLTVALQYDYIANNPYPMGQKEALNEGSESNSSYVSVHAKFHPILRQYLQEFEFYDIFLLSHRAVM
ncbi:hypothetical protein [Alishewanella sp. HL-SH06]|uniref:hypothetical protein n=1 Tax=Alishewanella sp. HL-SH06 TaxID=3461144 RepID=UPI0040436FEC